MTPENWRRPVCVSFYPETVDRIDAMRGDIPRSRWVEAVITNTIDALERAGGK